MPAGTQHPHQHPHQLYLRPVPGVAGAREAAWRAAGALACAAACSAAHGVLQAHYAGYCRGSWLALFAVDPSPYCALVRRALEFVQFLPLAALAPALLRPVQH